MNLKHTIKKVLREESNKLSNFLNQIIEQYGVEHALKLTGMDLLKLVNISGIEITSKIANKLLSDAITSNKITTEYNGFKIVRDHDVVQWEGKFQTGFFTSNVTEVITVMATPFWDGMTWTPIDLDWYSLFNKDMVVLDEIGGNSDYYTTFEDRTSFDNADELFEWYENVYLPSVYEIVMGKLLPEVQADMVEKMKD
jgi:hypothetical protein